MTDAVTLDLDAIMDGWQRAKDEDYPHVALFASTHFELLLAEVQRLRGLLAIFEDGYTTAQQRLDAILETKK